MAINKHQFGRAFRINNSFLPFEQWERKHRYKGKGYTRPRGKKFKNVVKRYDNGKWVGGHWVRKTLRKPTGGVGMIFDIEAGKPRVGKGTLLIKKDDGTFEEVGIVTDFNMQLR